MKKTILITLGTIILLIIGALWTYLLLYGAPENTEDIFGNFTSEEGEIVELQPVSTDQPQDENVFIPTDSAALRQLTTRSVAGAVMVDEYVYFVERGTGHIYELEFPYSTETRISNMTIPQTVHAVWSRNGDHVAITAQRNEKNETIVSDLISPDEDAPLEGVSLPEGSTNIEWSREEDTLFYLLPHSEGAQGYSYDPVTKKSVRLFDIPLREVRIIWGSTPYAYTTPTSNQTGHVYRIENEKLRYMRPGAQALMAIPYSGGMAYTMLQNNRAVSVTDEDSTALPITLLPEKCIRVPAKAAMLYCASPSIQPAGNFPDAWYKGAETYSDQMWLLELTDNRSMVLSSFLEETGREIDVSQIGTNESGSHVYFVNKNDGALWLLQVTRN